MIGVAQQPREAAVPYARSQRSKEIGHWFHQRQRRRPPVHCRKEPANHRRNLCQRANSRMTDPFAMSLVLIMRRLATTDDGALNLP